MLYEFIPKKGIGFEKYLVVFCMLIGVQASTFAQYTFLEVPSGTAVLKEGIVRVNKGDNLTLTVPFVSYGTPVKWEYRTKPSEDRQLLSGETNTTLEVKDIQSDIEYIATYANPLTGAESSARILIACVSLTSSSDNVCPNQAVAFDYTGGQFADKGKFEQKKDGPAWHNLKDFPDNSINQWIINESEKDFSVRVSLDYSYYNTTSATLSTDPISVTLRSDCKANCLTTTTGEYYVGTDFDPNKADPHKIPQDVINHFGDYNIELREADVKNYWLGSDAHSFFGQDPMDDVSAGVVGKNNYMFCQNPNDRICELIFSPVSEFLGKPYTYKMRMYLQKEKDCKIDENAKFKARTGQGKQTIDKLKGAAYLNSTGELLKTAEGYEEGDMTLSFKQLMDFSTLKDYDVIKVEITFEGRFPDSPNGLREFSFFPEFAQMSCWKVAIDYISAEVENVCLDPQILCAGEYTTAHAAGFPDGSVYRWYKKVGDSWIEDVSNYGKGNASIQAEKGLMAYQLRVDVPGLGLRVHDFTVSGNDCTVPVPTKINGGTFCMPNVQSYKPNIVDHAKEVTYKWIMYRPDNSVWYDSSDPEHTDNVHFKALPSSEFNDKSTESYKENKNDSLVISLNLSDTSTVAEGEYKLQLITMTGSIEYATLDTIVHIYRTPDIALKLTGDKYTDGMNESDKTICASDRRREIKTFAVNSFDSPMLSKYIYTWNSIPGTSGVFTPDPSDSRKATVNLAAIPGICDGDVDKVQISVQAYIGGCSDEDSNDYKVEKSEDPKVDCESLTRDGKDTFNLPVGQKTMIFEVPIPDYTSGCDTDPDLIIEYKPKFTGDTNLINKDVDPSIGGTITVRKSESVNNPLLNLDLPWGIYDFKYTVVDGCGKKDECNIDIVIKKDWGPDVDCDSIKDINTPGGGTDNGCVVIFDKVELSVPTLWDRNDSVFVQGIYSGRRHFETKQIKDILKGNSANISKFDKSIDLYDKYEVDYTYILWAFKNNAGKTTYCVQEVLIRDTAKIVFNCDLIDPFVFRPVTKPGECEIEFKEFWDSLKAKEYIGYDYCPEPVTKVYGELHEDSIREEKIVDDRVFKVGINDTVYWQFRDRHDYGDVVLYCPQVINAFSGDTINPDCESIAYREGEAEPGTCEVNAEKVDIPSPTAIEPCTHIVVPGVGTRSDNKDLKDPYPTGDTYITWVFKGENSFPDTCVTHVFIKGNKHPDLDCDLLFPKKWYEMPDCDSMDITLETKKVPDPCVAGFMSEGVPYINGEKIELKHKFPIGETFVTWKFWDYTKAVVDSCIQSIHLRDTFPPVVDCDTMNNDSVLLHDKCSIPTKDLRDSLEKKIAIEYCTGDTIWGEPYLINDKGERVEFPSEISVGIYPIQWVFANDSLTTKESVCDKTLYLLHDGAPIFDCSSLPSPLQLWDTTGECKILLNPNTLPIPEAVDSCKRDYIVYGHGYIQLFEKGEFIELCYFDREKNEPVYLMDIPLGGHKIKWIFKSPFSIKEKECEQIVKANSDAIKKIDCSKLAEYVHVTMRRQGPGATFQEVRDSGLILPNLDFDVCKVLDTFYTRDDNKKIYEIYPVNSIVTITWLFRDTTKNAIKEKVCHTIVEVQDGDTPICKPPLFDSIYTCLDALPAKYADYSEFRKAGGKLISNGVDVSDFVDPSTFKLDTMSLGDKCDFTFRRTYTVRNLRNQTVRCVQDFHVKDTVPPVWLDDAASLTKVFDCVAEDFFPTNLRAKDECSNEIISEYHKVNEFDGIVDGVFYTVSSNRSSDPRDCNYYNYEEVRRYIAVDRCRNRTERLKFVAQVQDTFAPIVNIPKTWRDSQMVAEYAVPCKFLVPDITNTLPDGSYSDSCDSEAAKYYKVTQKPEAGTEFNPDLGDQIITLYITDPCGLYDTVQHIVYVPTRKDVITIKMNESTICAEKNLLLKSPVISGISGKVYEFNKWTREWEWKKTDKVVYDYYRNEVDPENIIFSNNPNTYGNKFDPRSETDSIVLDKIGKTGLYYIVAMDTVRFCTDTASAYITIHSRPSIDLDASNLLVCENDSIHLISDNETLYDRFVLDVRDNGEEITEEGWMLDGEKYKPETLLEYTDALIKFKYYAVNSCGPGTSDDWVSLSMKRRMSPDNLMLTTEPNNPARVYLGESAKLNLVTKYKPEVYMWYRANGVVDGISDRMFDKYGNVREDYMDSDFEQDTLLGITNYGELGSKVWDLTELGDSAQYYVLLVDSVCPAVPSNIVSIDVVKKLPTAFTPHNSIGMNDVFMEGHKVVIFNRYGQKMVESDNGWDGTCRGNLVDPGVYYYEVIINEGEKHKGSIEVVYFK